MVRRGPKPVLRVSIAVVNIGRVFTVYEGAYDDAEEEGCGEGDDVGVTDLDLGEVEV